MQLDGDFSTCFGNCSLLRLAEARGKQKRVFLHVSLQDVKVDVRVQTLFDRAGCRNVVSDRNQRLFHTADFMCVGFLEWQTGEWLAEGNLRSASEVVTG